MKQSYIIAVLIINMLVAESSFGATRIKDIANVKGVHTQQLIGYGLVVGLNGSGDTYRSTFTLQSVTSMLKRFGITVAQDYLRLRNVAAVMVTASVSGYAKEGTSADVVVSSLGDATSLQGGTLLMTPISGIDGEVVAMAQGPVSVGGISVRAGGNEVRRNHTAAGRVPGGAVMEKSLRASIPVDSSVSIILSNADFTTAIRIAEAINGKFNAGIARADDASSVTLNVPPDFRSNGKLVEFISGVELLEITPDVTAKVVINERTGTIVIGGNVTILPVAISHGGLNIDIEATPVISQPNAFSQGQTVATNLMSISTKEDTSTVIALNGSATVQDVAKALNTLKVAPRDIIAIFQALKESAALKAELVII